MTASSCVLTISICSFLNFLAQAGPAEVARGALQGARLYNNLASWGALRRCTSAARRTATRTLDGSRELAQDQGS